MIKIILWTDMNVDCIVLLFFIKSKRKKNSNVFGKSSLRMMMYLLQFRWLTAHNQEQKERFCILFSFPYNQHTYIFFSVIISMNINRIKLIKTKSKTSIPFTLFIVSIFILLSYGWFSLFLFFLIFVIEKKSNCHHHFQSML